MTIFKPCELFYYEKENKLTTRGVEEFRTKAEALKRIEEIKAEYPNIDFFIITTEE